MTQEEIDAASTIGLSKSNAINGDCPIEAFEEGFSMGVEFAETKLYSEIELLEIINSFKARFILFAPNLTPETATRWFETVKK